MPVASTPSISGMLIFHEHDVGGAGLHGPQELVPLEASATTSNSLKLPSNIFSRSEQLMVISECNSYLSIFPIILKCPAGNIFFSMPHALRLRDLLLNSLPLSVALVPFPSSSLSGILRPCPHPCLDVWNSMPTASSEVSFSVSNPLPLSRYCKVMIFCGGADPFRSSMHPSVFIRC